MPLTLSLRFLVNLHIYIYFFYVFSSCVIYDSRLLHCGSANRMKNTNRAIFYFSFRNPLIFNPGNPPSIRRDLQQEQITLSNLQSILSQIHNNGIANPFHYDWCNRVIIIDNWSPNSRPSTFRCRRPWPTTTFVRNMRPCLDVSFMPHCHMCIITFLQYITVQMKFTG